MQWHSIRSSDALSISAVLFLAGCAVDIGANPITLRQGAEAVRLEAGPPPARCVELGDVVGLTDRIARIRFTPPETVEKDQRNALKNAANGLGGDYVYINAEDPKANSGTAFRCDTTVSAPSVTPTVIPSPAAPAPVAVPHTDLNNPALAEQSDSIRDRLELLKSLYEDGLITAEEYTAKKKAILDEL